MRAGAEWVRWAVLQAGYRRVALVGHFDTLEDQMCRFGTAESAGPPDRVDALVWALWALMGER